MNNQHDDERLDMLLNDWSAGSYSPERLSSLHDRIVTAATDPDDSEVETVRQPRQLADVSFRRVPPPAQPLRSRGPTAAAGLAASVLSALSVATLILLISSRGHHDAPGKTDSPPGYAWLRTEHVESKTVLLQEMDSLFDRRLAWLAETQNQMDFALLEHQPQTAADHPADRLAVRVVVERRPVGSSAWQLAWTVDVMSRSEEVVSVTPPVAGGNELQLWAYRLPDGTIAVDSALQFSGQQPFSTQTSGLHHDDTPMKVASAVQEDTEYRVFQSVAVLDGGVI